MPADCHTGYPGGPVRSDSALPDLAFARKGKLTT